MSRSILAAVLAAIAFAPAAHAANTPSNQVAVAYGDLDLTTSAGQAELNNRLQAAAGTLCKPVLERAPDSEPSVREHQILYRACVGRLTERAMAKVRLVRN